ncbi:MAG: FMN-binding protein [Peptoniphilus sp.]|nr:FMN-binding protein [Peptoniphilus sp.]MDD7362568.1 FMN-binding protein [Bacillota bacterium]MDY6045033.1 FMN-binding protein [Peptoniphilus sp.]
MKWRACLAALFMVMTLAACGGMSESYRDGSYIGEAKGHDGEKPIRVEVTIASGVMTDIEVLEHGESLEQVPQTKVALDSLPGAIVKKNSTNIDGIAGATQTSDGIKKAVNAALDEAKK